MVAETLRPKKQIKQPDELGLLDSKLILQSFLDYLNANGPEHFPDVRRTDPHPPRRSLRAIVPRQDRPAPRVHRAPERDGAQHEPDALRHHLREVLGVAQKL